jgi:hypothetical protein
MFLTAQLFAASVFAKQKQFRAFRFSTFTLYAIIILGAAGALLPLLIISSWFAPLIWLSFIFFLDPINYLRGWPSIVGDLTKGDWRRLFSLLAGGLICGLLWEFWNYWALSKWSYTVPYFGKVKIFEMPVLGYLGFPPFAVECWVIYIFFRSLLTPRLGGSEASRDNIWIEQTDAS